MNSNNITKAKSLSFAIRVVNLYKYLCDDHKEYVMSKQCLRSGTAVGALVREAEYAQSKLDFIHKLNISSKEANETLYWLELLYETKYIDEASYESIKSDGEELLKLLTSSIKTAKSNLSK
jgi:four helix bundle protein